MFELSVLFSGTVQGVSFRWTVAEHAHQHQISGSVRNLDNGNVEMRAFGSKEKLEAFLEEIMKHPGGAKITEVKRSFKNCEGELPKDFRIVR